jgi:hypothetical protein
MSSTSPDRATVGPAWWPTPTSKAPTARSIRASTRTPPGCESCSDSFRFPVAYPATSRPRHPGRSMRAVNWSYALVHAYGAAFDNPDLVVACVIGDVEAEAGPLAASWHSNKFLNPVRYGAVLPILQTGDRDRGTHQGPRNVSARRHRPQPGPLPDHGSRRDGTESAQRGVRVDRQRCGWPTSLTTTRTLRPTAA